MTQEAIDRLYDGLVADFRAGRRTQAGNVLALPVAPPEPGDVLTLPEKGTPAHEALVAAGRRALEQGELGVVILSGGMATRFDFDQPKGLYPIYEGKSFLQLKIEAVRALGARVPIYLMTSFATDQAIAEHVAAHGNFGVPEDELRRFRQFQFPRLNADGTPHHEPDGKLSCAAPGHGDFPDAFRESGALAHFLNGGGKYLLFSNVDNLGATVDLAIVGLHVLSGREMTVEVAPKSPGDQGGAPARVGDRLRLVEGFAFPPGFDQDAVSVFNTANYVFTAAALQDGFDLPWYVVEKKVNGEPVIQFERLAGDLSALLDTQYVRIEREERFLPVKNVADVPGVRAVLKRRWPETLATLR